MLLQSQVKEFLNQNYKPLIMSQLPNPYISENRILKISLKLDLSKILRTNRQIGTVIISNYPNFLNSAQNSIEQFIEEQNLSKPEHGVYLTVCISNCPLPTQNIRSAEFQLAGFEQPQGIMVYLKDLLVTEVSQSEMFVFSYTQVWEPRCPCSCNETVRRTIRKNLISIIHDNASQEDKLKIDQSSNKVFCQNCEKTYILMGREQNAFSNCQKITVQLGKCEEKENIFERKELSLYAETTSTENVKPGNIISCCAYIFLKPVPLRASANHQLLAKTEYSAFLINTQIHPKQENLLTVRPSNSDFFYEIGTIGLSQKFCRSLADNNTLLFNYQKLVQSVDKFRFAYLPPSMLTTLKLSLLNSVCNHHLNQSLHLCLIVEDLQLCLRVVNISGLNVRRFPSEYDSNSLNNWLKLSRGSIIVVVNPTKKDMQFLELYLSNRMKGFEQIRVTFWVICETNPKKDINIDHFGIVLDLTTQKNIHVCKEAIEETIDLKMSAFVSEDFDSFPTTIAKMKNPRSRMQLIDKRIPTLTPAQIEEQQAESKKILQKYYLKSRDLKKTSELTLSHMFQLAKGFSYLRSAMNAQESNFNSSSISILDSVLSIFLEEQSARNKVSNSNTIFGAEISKLILNQNECEISFWDFYSQEDGTVAERKNYMPKTELFKRMLAKLNSLLFEENELFNIDD